MRYSEQELLSIARSPPVIEGRMWYKQQRRRRESYRERFFRLKSNFLFYFRFHESNRTIDPLGALLLERCTIREEPMDNGRLVFSLEYQDEKDHKHLFAVSSTEEYRRWIDAIKTSSYERLKSTALLLERELARVKDVQQQHRSSSPKPKPRRPPPRRPAHPPTVKKQAVSSMEAIDDTESQDVTSETSKIQEEPSRMREDVRGEGLLIDIT